MHVLQNYARVVTVVFSGKYLLVHAASVCATLFLVHTGIDWAYFLFVCTHAPTALLHAADMLGFVLLPLVPILVLLIGFIRKQAVFLRAGVLGLYAVVVGFTLSILIKAFTGRTSPPHRHHGEDPVLIDMSHDFNFGFMEHHVIGGWPSSHATVAFALATVCALVLTKRLSLRVLCYPPALCIGLGVTFGYHWLSEFVAGALLGTVVGLAVVRNQENMFSKNSA